MPADTRPAAHGFASHEPLPAVEAKPLAVRLHRRPTRTSPQVALSPADCGKADQVVIMIVIVVCSFPPNVRHQPPRASAVGCMPWLGCLSFRGGILDGPFALDHGRPKARKVAG
jgi:hypothetical protein